MRTRVEWTVGALVLAAALIAPAATVYDDFNTEDGEWDQGSALSPNGKWATSYANGNTHLSQSGGTLAFWMWDGGGYGVTSTRTWAMPAQEGEALTFKFRVTNYPWSDGLFASHMIYVLGDSSTFYVGSPWNYASYWALAEKWEWMTNTGISRPSGAVWDTVTIKFYRARYDETPNYPMWRVQIERDGQGVVFASSRALYLGDSISRNTTAQLRMFSEWGKAQYDSVEFIPVKCSVRGKIAPPGYQGDFTPLSVNLEFRRTDYAETTTRQCFLDADGSFSVDNLTTGTYDVAVQVGGFLRTVLTNRAFSAEVVDLGDIDLKGADANGDNQISFEDFSILQNNYGQSGPVVTAAAHVVDGTLSAGEWANWYSDPVGDNSTNGGSVDLVGWGAEVRGDTFYAAFALDPNGPTVAQYNDFEGGKNIWLSMWFDVDPAANPMTGVPNGDSQFNPRAQDIYVELGTDSGTLEGSHDWHSLNFWGDGNDFAKKVPVEGSFAYSDHVVEFSCPVSAILAELPNTDNAAPASVWTVAARGAGYGFGGNWSGDITDLKPLMISDIHGRVSIPGYVGDKAALGVEVTFAPAGGGAAISETTLLNADGSFVVAAVPAGMYNVTIKCGSFLSAVLSGVSISDPTDLGTIELAGADSNGDNRIGFEDFSILQNNYGETGVVANPLAAAAVGGCGGLGVTLLSFLGLAIVALRLRTE